MRPRRRQAGARTTERFPKDPDETHLNDADARRRLGAGADHRPHGLPGGYYFVNAGSFKESGRWKAEDGKLCAARQFPPASCNEIRATPEHLDLKRDNGEVVTLVKQ